MDFTAFINQRLKLLTIEELVLVFVFVVLYNEKQCDFTFLILLAYIFINQDLGHLIFKK